MMKKALLCALPLVFLASSTTFAGKIKDTKDLIRSAERGRTIKFVIEVEKCKASEELKKTVLISNEVTNLIANDDGSVRTRGTILSTSVYSIPVKGPVLQAYTIDISEKGKVEIENQFLDPVTYTEKHAALKLSCELGDGFLAMD